MQNAGAWICEMAPRAFNCSCSQQAHNSSAAMDAAPEYPLRIQGEGGEAEVVVLWHSKQRVQQRLAAAGWLWLADDKATVRVQGRACEPPLELGDLDDLQQLFDRRLSPEEFSTRYRVQLRDGDLCLTFLPPASTVSLR